MDISKPGSQTSQDDVIPVNLDQKQPTTIASAPATIMRVPDNDGGNEEKAPEMNDEKSTDPAETRAASAKSRGSNKSAGKSRPASKLRMNQPESTTIAIPPTPDPEKADADAEQKDAAAIEVAAIDAEAADLKLKSGRFPHQPRKLASATQRPRPATATNETSPKPTSGLSRTASGRKRPLTTGSSTSSPTSGLLRPQDRERSDLSSPTLSILRNAVQHDMSHIHSAGETTDESKVPSANVEKKATAEATARARAATTEKERMRGSSTGADASGVVLAVAGEDGKKGMGSLNSFEILCNHSNDYHSTLTGDDLIDLTQCFYWIARLETRETTVISQLNNSV